MPLPFTPRIRKPDPAPLVTNNRAVIFTGMAVWGVLLIAALLGRTWLSDTGHAWWVWVPPAGLVLGVIGLRLLPKV